MADILAKSFPPPEPQTVRKEVVSKEDQSTYTVFVNTSSIPAPYHLYSCSPTLAIQNQ